MKTDLIITFLSSVPDHILERFDRPVTVAHCPVTQSASAGYPGGRAGYRQWLAERMDGERNVVPGIARRVGLSPADIGRVCIMGFSNGCIGVWEMLKANDAFKIDTVLAIDGIHGMLSWDGQIQPPLYKPLMNFAAHAAQRNPETEPEAAVIVITHSSIGPILGKDKATGRIVERSPSTTQTADVIWQTASTVFPTDYLSTDCGYGCIPNMHVQRIASQHASPIELRRPKVCNEDDPPKCTASKWFRWMGIQDGWYDRRGANNTYVFGWGEYRDGQIATKDPQGTTDHIFQAQIVLPAMLEEFCLNRWNRQCFTPAMSGVGGMPAIDPTLVMKCKLGQGIPYSSSTLQKVDFFPDLQPDTSVPPPAGCPTPPEGATLVGTPSDPCAYVGGAEPDAAAPENEEGLGLGTVVAGLASALAGYFIVRGWRR